MTKATEEPVTGLALLRRPFPDNQISKLPKESRAQIDERKANRNSAINCKVCGGWHHKNAVHLDYVGHAALTDRLLDTDIEWSWEPMAFGPDGLPALDRNGGMWIRLTVCGVSRIGYGSADGKTGGDAVKEVIGDALRNAAMRFGAALDLWHKGDLHVEEGDEKPKEEHRQQTQTKREPTLSDRAANLEQAMRDAAKTGDVELVKKTWERGAGVCAQLDTANPERLVELTKLYDELSDPIPF